LEDEKGLDNYGVLDIFLRLYYMLLVLAGIENNFLLV
jgi:hypothetical protein